MHLTLLCGPAMWGDRSHARRMVGGTVRWSDLRPYKSSGKLSLRFELNSSPFDSDSTSLLPTICLLTVSMVTPAQMCSPLWR
jgi:hypothetical protein